MGWSGGLSGLRHQVFNPLAQGWHTQVDADLKGFFQEFIGDSMIARLLPNQEWWGLWASSPDKQCVRPPAHLFNCLGAQQAVVLGQRSFCDLDVHL